VVPGGANTLIRAAGTPRRTPLCRAGPHSLFLFFLFFVLFFSFFFSVFWPYQNLTIFNLDNSNFSKKLICFKTEQILNQKKSNQEKNSEQKYNWNKIQIGIKFKMEQNSN
jgi:hypothetical protein